MGTRGIGGSQQRAARPGEGRGSGQGADKQLSNITLHWVLFLSDLAGHVLQSLPLFV